MEENQHNESENEENPQQPLSAPATLSKNAQKKLLKRQKFESKKAERKAYLKQKKRDETDRKRKEWEDKLSTMVEEEKDALISSRKKIRLERMAKRTEQKGEKISRLTKAKEDGINIIIDLDFSHLMTPSEINSLTQQIMYCYAVNGRSKSPAHLWLTGCKGEIGDQLERLPGFDKWIVEKESRTYFEALEEQKNKLVYLTADSETTLEEVDANAMYIIGGLVDRNRWKGITMKKAEEQGIRTAKLPIGSFVKLSSSQVLTVNQVVEIVLKYGETGDWKMSFFEVIPPRKIHEV